MNSDGVPMPKPKLWHCYNSRSLRPLWTMEEMGLDYDLIKLPFPPRLLDPDYLDINPLGTVPYFEHGEVQMTESVAICHYLVARYSQPNLAVDLSEPDYAAYLNWLYHSDATLTFPQTVVMRYSLLEPPERQLPQAVEDYGRWFSARLRRLNRHLESNDYLCAGRFTIADIAVAYALYFGSLLGLDQYYKPQVQDYLGRQTERVAFQRAVAIAKELDPFKE